MNVPIKAAPKATEKAVRRTVGEVGERNSVISMHVVIMYAIGAVMLMAVKMYAGTV